LSVQNIDESKVVESIENIRDNHGFSVRKIEKAIGLANGTLNRILDGSSSPRAKTMLKINTFVKSFNESTNKKQFIDSVSNESYVISKTTEQSKTALDNLNTQVNDLRQLVANKDLQLITLYEKIKKYEEELQDQVDNLSTKDRMNLDILDKTDQVQESIDEVKKLTPSPLKELRKYLERSLRMQGLLDDEE
jgi:transcriptional regulator with XRE-family HTH domain